MVAMSEVVTNRFALEKQILFDIGTKIEGGEIIILTGPSGSGKTTVLRAVTGILSVHDGDITKGSVTFEDQRIESTAQVIRKLDEAGAVLIAKTTLGALAMGDVWFGGKTKNPWNLEEGSSGSSAGSASAVSGTLLMQTRMFIVFSSLSRFYSLSSSPSARTRSRYWEVRSSEGV